MTQKILSLIQLAQYLGVSRPTLYKMMGQPGFPAPVVLPGMTAKRWRVADLDRWLTVQKSAAE
jgi:excisionase family DNA binding protein